MKLFIDCVLIGYEMRSRWKICNGSIERVEMNNKLWE